MTHNENVTGFPMHDDGPTDTEAKGACEVVIVDDDLSLLRALTRQVATMGHRVRAFHDPETALEYLRQDNGTCLVVDLLMPGMSGLELQKHLDERSTSLPIVFLSGHGTVQESVRALRAGALNFLEKPVEYDVLKRAIDEALAKAHSEVDEQARGLMAQEKFDQLSEREREVFSELLTGDSNKSIAQRLGITERTVKAHKASLMTKLEAGSIVDILSISSALRLAEEE